MEDDWNKIAAEINEKIKKAGLLMKEVNKLREKGGVSSFTSYNFSCDDDQNFDEVCEEHYIKMELIDFDPLFNELEDGGWSTSSMDCPT